MDWTDPERPGRSLERASRFSWAIVSALVAMPWALSQPGSDALL